MNAKVLKNVTKMLQVALALVVVFVVAVFFVDYGRWLLTHAHELTVLASITSTLTATVLLWPTSTNQSHAWIRISNELRGAMILTSIGMTGYALGIDRISIGFLWGIGAGLLVAEGVRLEKAGKKNGWLPSGF